MKILIAEDDMLTREGLVDIMEDEGYTVVAAGNGKDALAQFKLNTPDVVCLDIMMPDLNGYDVCREIRRMDENVPILFISAKSEEIDKVLGLELGADDFIVKPFGVKEVIARIRAVTRRYLAGKKNEAVEKQFEIGDLTVIPAELRVYRGEEGIEVSLKEIKILALFHHNKGKLLTRDALFDACWGMDYLPNSRTLDQHISQLRKKIEVDPKSPQIIHTIHGAGYRYD